MASDCLFFNTAEVARLLRISVRTVCVWAECSELPAFKVGRQWRFRRDDISAWLEGAKRTASKKIVPGSAAAAMTAPAEYSSADLDRILILRRTSRSDLT